MVPQAKAREMGALGELMAEAGMSHSLTPLAGIGNCDALKPALDRHFKPLGHRCVGGTGTFTRRRRTAANHVVNVALDVGTWSRRVMAQFRVYVLSDQFSLPMPVAQGLESSPQVAIGDAARWEQKVENLAALTAYLERRIVPEIEAAAGAAPDWFDAPAP